MGWEIIAPGLGRFRHHQALAGLWNWPRLPAVAREGLGSEQAGEGSPAELHLRWLGYRSAL